MLTKELIKLTDTEIKKAEFIETLVSIFSTYKKSNK